MYVFAVIAGLYTGFIFGVFDYVYLNFIDPEFVDRILDKTYNDLVGSGLGEKDIRNWMEITENSMKPVPRYINNVIGMPFVAAFFGLISSAFAMKKDPSKFA